MRPCVAYSQMYCKRSPLKRGEQRVQPGTMFHLQGFDGLALFSSKVHIVELPQKEQVGDLLDDCNGVGDAVGPEGFPDLVNSAFEFAGEHGGLGAVWK